MRTIPAVLPTCDSLPTPDPALPERLLEVGCYRDHAEASAHGLVILAAGEPYWLVSTDGCHRLLVEPDAVDHLRSQLARFDEESIGWPPRPVESVTAVRRVHFVASLLWALAVLAIFWAEASHPGWVDRGALDADAVFNRFEWWRTVTALFLHADTAHLASNVLAGIFIFTTVATVLGSLRGWLALAASALLGNLAAAAVNAGTDYRSLGASTAVFAAVGLLTGHAVRRMSAMPPRHRWRAVLAPLGAGVTMLALYGSGGLREHVDVIAHLTGFLAGLALGMLFRAMPKRNSGRAK